jgi:hypothetical protein
MSTIRKYQLELALAGLFISIGGTLFWKPLLTLAQQNSDKISISFPIYAYLFFLIPLVFFLNTLFFLLHITAHAPAPEGSPTVFYFLSQYLPQASRTVSLASLVISAPLSMHAAFAEESVGLAIGTVVVCLSLVTLLSSGFNNIFVSKGFIPILVSIFISNGFFTFLSSDNNHCDPIISHHIAIQLPLLSLVSFVVSTLGITLLILRIGAPGVMEAKNSVITALSLTIAALLVGGYLAVYAALTDMAAVTVKTAEI